MIFRVDFKSVEAEESRLLSWGSFLLLRVLDLCYALGEGRVMTITDGRKCQRGISEGESPPYMRGRRIPTVVMGVASPSFPCALQCGVNALGNKRRSDLQPLEHCVGFPRRGRDDAAK